MDRPADQVRGQVAEGSQALGLPTTETEERISVATQWQLMWWRFRKHKLAMAAAIILIIFYLAVIFADLLAYAIGITPRIGLASA